MSHDDGAGGLGLRVHRVATNQLRNCLRAFAVLSAGHEAARDTSPYRPGIGNEAVRDGIGA